MELATNYAVHKQLKRKTTLYKSIKICTHFLSLTEINCFSWDGTQTLQNKGLLYINSMHLHSPTIFSTAEKVEKQKARELR